MALLNYTTTISVDKTVGEIHGMLVRAGARSIMTDYDANKLPSSLSFLIDTKYGSKSFKLPANIDAVFKTLTVQNQRGQVQRRFVSRDQAAKVGWRILKDWTEAQLAIIESGMVTLHQVMLPYQEVNSEGQTMYEYMEQRQLALPAAESGR